MTCLVECYSNKDLIRKLSIIFSRSCTSVSPSGISSSKASCSTTKKPSKCSRYFPGRLSGYSVKKCGRGRPRKQERKNAASELKDVSTERNDWPEETPESYDVNTPEKTLSRSSENATRMSFSDDDEDMNIDFDMDFDSFSTTEKPSNSPSPISDSSPKNWGRGRPRKQEREKNAASELKDVSTERNDWSEETPESCDMNTPEKILSHSNESATKMSFSDDDEDMNVDFDMDCDSSSTTEKSSKCSRYSPSPISDSSLKKQGRGRPRKQERENNCSSSFLSGLSSSKGSLSTTKEPSNCSRYLSSPISDGSLKKRGRGRPRKQERGNAASESKDVSTEKSDWSEETPESCDMNTPEKILSHSNESATKMSFSDDDEDMNVDFDMDFDSDEDIRNEEYVGDGDSVVVDKTKQDNDSSDAKKTDGSPEYHSSVANLEEAKHVAKDDPRKGAEKNGGSRRSCATLNTGKILLVSQEESKKSNTFVSVCTKVCSNPVDIKLYVNNLRLLLLNVTRGKVRLSPQSLEFSPHGISRV